MHTVILGGKKFVIQEPVFKDLKQILAALNRLNNPTKSDFDLVTDIQIILTCLIGAANVKKIRRFSWEAWKKIPAPSPEELTALFSDIPELCGFQRTDAINSVSTSTDHQTDWDIIYWRVIRLTGWSWDQVDKSMTLSRLASMTESLNVTPDTDTLVAAYLGYEYKKPRTLEDAIDAMLASTPLSPRSQ